MVASENYFQRMAEAKINQKPRDVKSRGFEPIHISCRQRIWRKGWP